MPYSRVVIFCSVVFAAAPALRADPASDYRGQIRQQREQFETSVRAQPRLDQTRIDQLFQLRLEGKHLVLDTRLPPTRSYSSMRAELEGFAFPAVVARSRLGRAGASQFEFVLDDYADPDSFARLHVLSRPGMLHLDKMDQRFDGTSRVRLIQGERQVHLAVFDRDRTRNVTLVADDFAALRREYPREVDQFVRPLLREIRQEAAFAPDAATAWQVLADAWPLGDPSLPGRLAAELPALEDDDFRLREAAAGRLLALGRDAVLVIRRMDRAPLTAEQNAQLDALADRFEPLPRRRAAELRDDATFLLDCLYADEATARRLALARLSKLVGRPLELDVDVPLDMRVPLVDRLRREILAARASAAAGVAKPAL
jgi:hypothetical protein